VNSLASFAFLAVLFILLGALRVSGRRNAEWFRAHGIVFCLTEIFFFFLVGRNSANFASARRCKLAARCRLACGGEAKLAEFRLGGRAKIAPGEALFI
jgi:hypothetical protein